MNLLSFESGRRGVSVCSTFFMALVYILYSVSIDKLYIGSCKEVIEV
jgi:hypothetical protein